MKSAAAHGTDTASAWSCVGSGPDRGAGTARRILGLHHHVTHPKSRRAVPALRGVSGGVVGGTGLHRLINDAE